FVAAIKDVCDKMGNPDDKMNREPWPSHIYFEDVNARSQFDLIEIIIRTVRDEGRLALKYSNN
ncbi:MAG: hypothetical protein HN491_13375, partial [Rhodospirillales bacterium]|nr:hypothetical protein [Rhodospirillales bacterium]